LRGIFPWRERRRGRGRLGSERPARQRAGRLHERNVVDAGPVVIQSAALDLAFPHAGTTTRSRWMKGAALALIGLVAAWSWLFLVSTWGPAGRIDIMTFKAGLTSKIMRTLLRQGEGTGHHSHASTMIS